jgi:hypothetical protein
MARPEWLDGVKRGKIEGLSYASAKRLRELLFGADFQRKGIRVSGLCLTLPKEAKVGDGEQAFFSMKSNKKLWFPSLVGLVWRKEVQRNGREHYHLILWEKNGTSEPDLRFTMVARWCNVVAGIVSRRRPHKEREEVRRMMWWAHTRGMDLGETDTPPSDVEDESIALFVDRWPAVTPISGPGDGVCYLIDHTSKHKAYQAKTMGRAWGAWCRASLPRLEHSEVVELSVDEAVKVARVARKLSRYWVKDARCVFGWRWCRGRSFRRGRNVVPSPSKAVAVARYIKRIR